MITCPNCKHEFEAKNQVKGGKARWKGVSKSAKSQAMSDAAKARWANKKADEQAK